MQQDRNGGKKNCTDNGKLWTKPEVVSNSISRDFDFQYIEKKITSKNDKFNHGIGLSNIKEVIEHYQGDIRYTVEKDIVCAEIVLFHVVMY